MKAFGRESSNILLVEGPSQHNSPKIDFPINSNHNSNHLRAIQMNNLEKQ